MSQVRPTYGIVFVSLLLLGGCNDGWTAIATPDAALARTGPVGDAASAPLAAAPRGDAGCCPCAQASTRSSPAVDAGQPSSAPGDVEARASDARELSPRPDRQDARRARRQAREPEGNRPSELAAPATVTNSAKSESESAAATNTASVASEPNCIDLNSASANELTRLPGIGPARAEAIVALRQRRPFEKPGDVRKVKGIGPATFARMRDQICPMEGEGP